MPIFNVKPAGITSIPIVVYFGDVGMGRVHSLLSPPLLGDKLAATTEWDIHPVSRHMIRKRGAALTSVTLAGMTPVRAAAPTPMHESTKGEATTCKPASVESRHHWHVHSLDGRDLKGHSLLRNKRHVEWCSLLPIRVASSQGKCHHLLDKGRNLIEHGCLVSRQSVDCHHNVHRDSRGSDATVHCDSQGRMSGRGARRIGIYKLVIVFAKDVEHVVILGDVPVLSRGQA